MERKQQTAKIREQRLVLKAESCWKRVEGRTESRDQSGKQKADSREQGPEIREQTREVSLWHLCLGSVKKKIKNAD